MEYIILDSIYSYNSIPHLVEYKLFIDSNVWTWIMSFIVDGGAILGYLFGLHNKMHKSISREKLIPRIVRNHHRKK